MKHHDQGTHSRPGKHVFARQLLIALFLVITLAQRGVPSGMAANIPLSRIRIAFTQHNNVFLMDGTGKLLDVITTRGTGPSGEKYVAYPWYQWSPDGKYLLVVRETGYPISWDLLLMNARGNLVRTLATGLPDATFYPSWAFDADQIAYVGAARTQSATENGGIPSQVYGVDVQGHTRMLWSFEQFGGCGGGSGGPAANLQQQEEQGYYYAPTLQWSVRQRLVILSDSCDGGVEGLDTETGQQLWPASFRAGEATLTHSGQVALVRSSACGSSGSQGQVGCVVLADPRTGETRHIIAMRADLPSWSSDERTLYFVQHLDGPLVPSASGKPTPRPRIAIMRAHADGSQLQQLVTEDAYATGPLHPTANGRYLIFSHIPDDLTWRQKKAALPPDTMNPYTDPSLKPYIPQVSIQRLDLVSGTLTTILRNAGRPEVQP